MFTLAPSRATKTIGTLVPAYAEGELTMAEVNMEKLEELAGKVVGDVAGAMGVFMSYLGDQAGVFEAIDEAGPVTVDQLAQKTGMNKLYLRE